jgi:AAA15 family ATPase/GTPase
MFLRELDIRNYRSLEAIQLAGLSGLNVLIGRNNSGKSAVFGALEVLNKAIHGQDFEWSTALTAKDPKRALEIRLLFEMTADDRRQFIACLDTTRNSESQFEGLLIAR